MSGTSGLLWREALFRPAHDSRHRPAFSKLRAAALSLAGTRSTKSGTGPVTVLPFHFCASDGASLGLSGLVRK